MTNDTTIESRELARIRSGAEWDGYLTLANLDAVHDRLTALIGGGRRFTVVYSNEDFWAHRAPEVRTSQTATLKLSQYPDRGRAVGDITINESGWTSWLETSVADQVEALALGLKRRPPYLHFKHDRVEISHRAPAGNRYFQVYAVEGWDL